MIKNEDYYSHEFKVSFETWKKFNEVIAEIDNILSSKYIELDHIKSFERKKDNMQVLLDYKQIQLVGEIEGLIKTQLIIQNMIIGAKND